MRTIITFFIILFISSIFAQKEITLVKATKYYWQGGQENSGGGLRYDITIKTPYGYDTLILDSVWVGEYYRQITNLNNGQNLYTKYFKPGILNFRVAGTYANNRIDRKIKRNDVTEYNTTPPPYKYKGELLLKYRIKHVSKSLFFKKTTYTVKYLEIENVIQTRTMLYP